MTFLNSLELLAFHNVAYTIYALLIIAIIAWFGYNLTRSEAAKPLVRIPFYGFIAFLVAAGVGHHIFTYNVVPWVAQDIMREVSHQIKSIKLWLKNISFNFQVKSLSSNAGKKYCLMLRAKI
jgi:cytochrome c oxidase subunit 2